MGIQKGTKLTDKPKVHTLKFRCDDETNNKLGYLSEKQNKSKSDIIRKGIDIQYQSEKQ